MKPLRIASGGPAPGRVEVVLEPAAEAGGTLAAFLETHGFPLNSRCGGRGLCHGCEVELGGRWVKSCQVSVGEALAAGGEVAIGPASLRNERLAGVQEYELQGVARDYAPVPRAGLGLAVDVGTTNLAGALWDLSTGRCLAVAGRANAQGRFGDNVLARIDYGTTVAWGGENLRQALGPGSLAPLAEDLAERAGTRPEAITEGVVAGNPIMLHTLAGASLEGFLRYPFRPVFLDARTMAAEAVGLPGSYAVTMVPGFGAFVGADIAAGALACGMAGNGEPSLLIDFGTNGEMLLREGGRCWATATAVGPAFEGGRLECGATAAPGVVSSLAWGESGWQPQWVGGGEGPRSGKARGLSGAAYIDFLALARAQGMVNPLGRLTAAARARVARGREGQVEQRLELGWGLHVSEADIAELLKAKAAIGAGMLALLDCAGLRLEDLRRVFVAGSFGYHLQPEHAMAIGLLPGLPRERLHLVGNASLGGASLLLLNPGLGEPLAAVRARTQCVELNLCPGFGDAFADCLALEPLSAAGAGQG